MDKETDFIIRRLYDAINSNLLKEHEKDFVESLFMKCVYGRREADPTEIKTLKRMYQIFLLRSQ
jgi:hypothetical protein